MTDRLYYHDSYLTEFRARVVGVSPDAASPDRQRPPPAASLSTPGACVD